MDYSEFDENLPDWATEEVLLEPNIDVGDSDLGDENLMLLEELLNTDENFDELTAETFPLIEDDFSEGNRREKANQRRSATNQRNIVRLRQGLVRVKKTSDYNKKMVKIQRKRNRTINIRNRKSFQRIKIDMRRMKGALKAVGRRATENTASVSQLRLMAIPKALGSFAAPFIKNDLLKAFTAALPELAAVVPASSKRNKWTVVGLAAATTLAPLIIDQINGQND